MQLKWVIFDHHIALDTGTEIFHPNASEVYAFAFDNEGEDVPNPIEQLSNLHFSQIGAPVKCELITHNMTIEIKLYVKKRNKEWPVDVIDGYIIDHGVTDREWFYVNGDLENLQTMFNNAGIKKCGEISIGQYIDLIKQELFSSQKEIEDHVDKEVIKQLLVPSGEVPKSIYAQLYGYQKIGFLWMRNMISMGHGCILGDEMGLGKTLQVITVFQDLKEKMKTPNLVIAPVSLLENWKRECSLFPL